MSDFETLKSKMTVDGELRLAIGLVSQAVYFVVYHYWHELEHSECGEFTERVEQRRYYGSYKSFSEAVARFDEVLNG